MFPRLLTWGDFVLPTYGVLVALAFLAGLLVATRLAARQGLDPDRALNLGVYAALAAIAGAKIFMVAEDWSFYSAHPRAIFSLDVLRSGGVFYGGFLAALAAAALYMRSQGLPFLKTSDAFVPGVALGHAIGRLGCFSAGCCWGQPTRLPWGVVFTDPYAADGTGVPLGVRLHPTQLYESLADLIIFLVLLALWKRKTWPNQRRALAGVAAKGASLDVGSRPALQRWFWADGQVLSLYFVLYGLARFGIEFLRNHPGGLLVGGVLSTSQLIALLLIPSGLVLWAGRRSRPAGLVLGASHVPRS